MTEVLDEWIPLVLLTGALGTTSMGIVETLKRTFPWFATVGYTRLMNVMGRDAILALRRAYGDGVEQVIMAAYRQSDEALARVLRNGVKVGLVTCEREEQGAVAKAFGQSPGALGDALAVDPEAAGVDDAELRQARHALSQFEMAVDVRVDAAVASSSDVYAGGMQAAAAVVAVALALAAGYATLPPEGMRSHMVWAFFIGVAAVPVAPIANDVAGALKTAGAALAKRGS